MTTFLAAYAVVGLSIAVFVARLGIRQARLRRAVEEFQSKRAEIASAQAASVRRHTGPPLQSVRRPHTVRN
jgi:CcmD family protein